MVCWFFLFFLIGLEEIDLPGLFRVLRGRLFAGSAVAFLIPFAIAGIFGTFFSGILSDRFFNGTRNLPALIFGIIYALATAMFVLGPADPFLDTVSMVLFGVALGVLMVYLGGLMAVDICSKEVSGSVLGIVGLASYLGAGLQDIISGWLIEDGKTIVNGQTTYNFDMAGMLWIGSAVVSLLLATLVWNVRSPD